MVKDESCVFCKIAQKKIKVDVIDESDNFVAFSDASPKARGHTLIIPKKHFVTLLDIPDKLGNEMLNLSKKIAFFLLDKKYGDGFNVIMNNLEPAGQKVNHAHLHIIPRKSGDGLITGV